VRSVLLSEAFTLSVQRIAMIKIAALRWQRCTDSVNASLSGAFNRALAAGIAPGVRFNRPRWGLAKARGASVSPNKPMQRTVQMSASFLGSQRAAADRQRYVA
jgi:hypothetical protein